MEERNKLLLEIQEVVEELRDGATIGITKGNMGHDVSNALNVMVTDYLKIVLDVFKGEANNGGAEDVRKNDY